MANSGVHVYSRGYETFHYEPKHIQTEDESGGSDGILTDWEAAEGVNVETVLPW